MADDNDAIIATIKSQRFEFGLFMDGVRDFFVKHPELSGGAFPAIHSVRWRMKGEDNLREKLRRKQEDGRKITCENVFEEITDVTGVRVLHLHQEQLEPIDIAIRKRVSDNDWVLHEEPKAYTWDPESVGFMKSLGLNVEQKESFYTSVHYVVRPRKDAKVACEIQVRTLFEEIWGEVDHHFNYPTRTTHIASKEQILVLAKLVGAGSRLLDALFRTESASKH